MKLQVLTVTERHLPLLLIFLLYHDLYDTLFSAGTQLTNALHFRDLNLEANVHEQRLQPDSNDLDDDDSFYSFQRV